MNIDRIKLLCKERLISEKKLLEEVDVTSSNIHDLDSCDETSCKKVSNYFNVSRLYLDSGFKYHILLRHGNIFIISLFLLLVISLLLVFFLDGSFLGIVIESFVSIILSIIGLVYYRNYKLRLLLYFPLLQSIFFISIMLPSLIIL